MIVGGRAAMIVGAASPLNRVHEILQRMREQIHHVESLKMCCGVLAILSRDEANKLLIARDGLRLLRSMMDQHAARADLLEAACDLLWALAFNNALLKEVIGRQGGIAAIVHGMKMHPANADFLKSACGALSNMCQNVPNQDLISQHGGVPCLLRVLRDHRADVVLLPFAFDALASLIVGNAGNATQLSALGAADAALAALHDHASCDDLAKSACHALAILSDTRGFCAAASSPRPRTCQTKPPPPSAPSSSSSTATPRAATWRAPASGQSRTCAGRLRFWRRSAGLGSQTVCCASSTRTRTRETSSTPPSRW
ncbi:armadillo-type protein [Pelagophyceae sp. CCMP2097]|nr:armadillo-type protein [Pelagophyceae sp. CCMP2097]